MADLNPPIGPPGSVPPPDANDERELLAGQRRLDEDVASAQRIFHEFLYGFEKLTPAIDRPCVTVFGSARFAPGHHYYELARAVGAELARQGFAVMTGGGPGVMEAANRGAKEAGGLSIGANIILPHEQDPNAYLDHVATFDHFFVRKVMLVKYSSAFIMLPGGFGTLDEMFETLTLIQTRKIEQFPVVVMGVDFWENFRDFVQDALLECGTISPGDLNLLQVTDSPEQAVAWIRQGMG
jgi:uncharacterized protein (TIGR00730 family)